MSEKKRNQALFELTNEDLYRAIGAVAQESPLNYDILLRELHQRQTIAVLEKIATALGNIDGHLDQIHTQMMLNDTDG